MSAGQIARVCVCIAWRDKAASAAPNLQGLTCKGDTLRGFTGRDALTGWVTDNPTTVEPAKVTQQCCSCIHVVLAWLLRLTGNFLKHFSEFAILVHLRDDVTPAKELPIDVKLGDCWPITARRTVRVRWLRVSTPAQTRTCIV